MAMKRLYQIYDLTAGSVIGPIIIEHRDAAAVRSFHGVLANKETTPGQYPEEFELRCLGTQDEKTAIITPETPWILVTTGKDWLQKQTELRLVDHELPAH